MLSVLSAVFNSRQSAEEAIALLRGKGIYPSSVKISPKSENSRDLGSNAPFPPYPAFPDRLTVDMPVNMGSGLLSGNMPSSAGRFGGGFGEVLLEMMVLDSDSKAARSVLLKQKGRSIRSSAV